MENICIYVKDNLQLVPTVNSDKDFLIAFIQIKASLISYVEYQVHKVNLKLKEQIKNSEINYINLVWIVLVVVLIKVFINSVS